MASSITNWVDEAQEHEQNLAAKVESINIRGPGSAGINGGSSQTASCVDKNTQDLVDNFDEVPKEEMSLLVKMFRNGLVKEGLKDSLEINQKDPKSPLFSPKSFEELNLRKELLKGIYEMGFNAPSRIQEAALPLLLDDPPQDLIAQSQSGTGKTAAFVLAMLSRVNPAIHEPQVLCLSPTYELAVQTLDVASAMAKYCPEIKFHLAVRGNMVAPGEKIKEHIIIGTPGKINDFVFRSRAFDISKIKVFVLDEADVMIATQGYGDTSVKLHRRLSPHCQKMLFSATYEEKVMNFAEDLLPNATVMRLKREEESLENIKQFYVMCGSEDDKYRAIASIYSAITIGQAIIFCQTRRTASSLVQKLCRDGHTVALLSGELTVDQRFAVLSRFRDCKERILVTTNVMARGIDVERVTLVVNYDLPMDFDRKIDFETYLHRIGRTGRFGKIGLAINLVDGRNQMRILKKIESHFGRPILELDVTDISGLQQLEES